MTNSELLAYKGNQLSGLDGQRRYVLRQLTRPMGCPNCGTLQSFIEAKRLTVDAFDTDVSHPDKSECIKCGRGIDYTVPMMGDAHWTLVPVPA